MHAEEYYRRQKSDANGQCTGTTDIETDVNAVIRDYLSYPAVERNNHSPCQLECAKKEKSVDGAVYGCQKRGCRIDLNYVAQDYISF